MTGIVGAGRVGLSLAMALRDSLLLSGHYRGPLPHLGPGQEADFLDKCETVFIAVKDAEIRAVAKTLAAAKRDLRGRVFLHASGAQGAEALEPLRETGAACGVAHPIQSFPEADPALLRDIYFGVAGDPEAVARAEEMIQALGSRSVLIKDPLLYHAACVFASGFVAILMKLAQEMIRAGAHGDERALVPLLKSTVQNIENMGPQKAMTGPWVRGDDETVASEIKALSELDPKLGEIYRAIAEEG